MMMLCRSLRLTEWAKLRLGFHLLSYAEIITRTETVALQLFSYKGGTAV